MPNLLLLRHAAAESGEGISDDERALTPAGRDTAKAVGDLLRKHGPLPDLVLCSPALRARQSLDALADLLDTATVEVEDGLYEATADELAARLRAVDDGVTTLLVVGHNPTLQELALRLVTDDTDRDRLERFPAGALAVLGTHGGWDALDQADMRLAALHLPAG